MNQGRLKTVTCSSRRHTSLSKAASSRPTRSKPRAAFIYVNHEYHEEEENLKKALAQAKAQGFLGINVLGSGVDLDLQVFEGHGSYVAGEETAMLESMQGASGDAETEAAFLPDGLRPLREADAGQQCRNLVQHSADPPERGGLVHAGRHRKCPGTMMFSLSGAVNRPGV